MKIKSIQDIRPLVRKFRSEILFHPEYEHLDIVSVFIDGKGSDKRVILIIKENADLAETEALAKKHFKRCPFKVISREGQPKVTAEIKTGNGLSHERSNQWGSFGGIFIKESDPDNTYGLSNNHVIALLNKGKKNDLIKYREHDTSRLLNAGKLIDWIPIKPPPEINNIDAAIFQLNGNHQADWDPESPGNAIVGPRLNLRVYKKGFKTGLTRGIVEAYDGAAKVVLNNQEYNFVDIIAIKGLDGPFNKPGDSGSIVFTENHFMVAIVFARFHEYCWALPISNVKPLLL